MLKTNNLESKFDFHKVNFNSGLLLKELEKIKVKLSFIDNIEIIKATKNRHQELIYDITTSLISFPAGWITGDKFYTKKILSWAKIPIAPGKIFTLNTKSDALNYATKIGYPVVLKPLMKSHGDYVYTGIENKKELNDKIERICEECIGSGHFLLEKHIFGDEYRIFIAKNGFIAGIHRVPANVTGDGKQSILALIQAENYRRMNPRVNCLCEIRMDNVLFDHLEKKGLSIDSIPNRGEYIQLRLSSNVSKGGNCYDITDSIHPSVKKLALKILTLIPGLSYIGIDIICQNISKPLDKQRFIVCELNSIPGLSLHTLPEKGKSRNVAAHLAKILFEETIL